MNDGGPAFPCAKFIHGPNGDATIMMGGMSLRDYFAAAALTGYRCGANGAFTDPAKLAQWAYADADAMLAEREMQTPAAERTE